jgi:hypothetical protein
LDWVFTIQTERVVAKDNTVAIAARSWQLAKSRFRHTLAGSTVTIHEHLDGSVSMRYGPHVVGRFHSNGSTRKKANPERRLLSVAVNEKPRRREPPKPKTGHLDLLPTYLARNLTQRT